MSNLPEPRLLATELCGHVLEAYGYTAEQMLAYGEVVRAEQRESDALTCDAIETEQWNLYRGTGGQHTEGMSDGATECAAAIRSSKPE